MSVTCRIKEEVVPRGEGGTGTGRSGPGSGCPAESGAGAPAQAGPDQLARELRIDEASVDVEVAWENRAQAEQALADAEAAAAAAIERLLAERLAVKDVVHLTGLDQATVRRLRQLETADEPGTEPVTGGGVGSTAEGADAEVA